MFFLAVVYYLESYTFWFCSVLAKDQLFHAGEMILPLYGLS